MKGGHGSSQDYLPGLSPVATAVQQLAEASTDNRGAIFTKKEVVDFMLDLIGYVPSVDLQHTRLLEPSFGHGDFLIPAITRLLKSLKKQNVKLTVSVLEGCVRAVELHKESYLKTRSTIETLLADNGLRNGDRQKVIDAWLINGDFLLTPFDQTFTHIVGNPPYIRQEMVPPILMAEYRRRYETIYDRADIYVPFMENSLKLLSESGVLGFICADRWMKNKYGGRLRELVSQKYHLRMYIDMVGTSAFHSDVIAYPAITIIANEPSGPTYIAKRPEIEVKALQKITELFIQGNLQTTTVKEGPWTLEKSESVDLVKRLEAEFPSLEETGCKVGIGVATGADKIFVAPFTDLNVEQDRKIPLVMTKDIQSGLINWRGLAVINPFDSTGKLVTLSEYPKLNAYLKKHEDVIKKRHVSQKNPNGWYRTIDRIYPEIQKKEKLLIPDIKGDAHIVYDKGEYYPHHNLYYITATEWDLRALRCVLLSGIAKLFIETYSTKMHGDALRFQAQYLRRIRIPLWKDVPKDLREILSQNSDPDVRDRAVGELYKLTSTERAIIKK